MFLAKPSRETAAAYKLNTNHHVRVWCSCMDEAGVVVSPRTTFETLDPRRLGEWDALGAADVREPFSALRLFRDHLREREGLPPVEPEYDMPLLWEGD